METNLLFEFAAVIVELAVFMATLTAGAVIIEVVAPWFARVIKTTAVKLAASKERRQVSAKTTKRTQGV